MRLGWFCSTKNGLDFSHYGRHYAYSISAVWDVSPRLGYSCNTKDQRVFFHTLAFIASHEARRRMAVFAIQLAWSHIRPSSREACCRAAVSPQPTCFPTSTPAPKGRGVESRGTAPCASGGISAANLHVALRPCAPKARSPGSRGTAPCAHEIFRKLLGRAKVVSSGFFFSDEGKYGIIQCVGQVAGRKRPG